MEVINVVHKPDQVDPSDDDRRHIVELLKEDKLAEAAQFSEGLIVEHPKSFLLFYCLGMCYVLLNENEKARTHLNRAVKLNPNVGDAWRYLGDCCLTLELNDEARDAYDAALKINSEDIASRRGLVQSAVDPKKFGESVERLEALVKESPDNPNLQIVLGQCYLEEEKYKLAIDCLEKAAEAIPKEPTVQMLVGSAYAGFHKPKDAMKWYRKAMDLEPSRPRLLMMMANAAKDDGDFDGAVKHAKEAIKLYPEGTEPKNNLAHIYTILGDKKKADDLREKVLKEHPDDIGAIIGLTHSKKFEKGDPRIKVLEEAYAQEPENHFEEKSKMNVGFSLGSVYGDIGEYGKSIEALKHANAKRRELIEFDFDQQVEQFKLIKHVFDPITPDDYAEPGKNDRRMIFILGMPRSGTTLTEQIISTHSKVYGAGELNFMNEETAELMFMFGLQPHVKLEKIAFEHIRPKYLEHIESLGMKERIVTDKLPHNFLRLGYILCCFPEAKVIHLNRDPVAVCFSCFQKFFPARGMGFTFGMRDLGLYYGMYLDLMDYWRKKFPGRILELDYKKLTEDQEGQTRMLLEHCGLPWEDQCLEFYKTKRGVLTASQIQVRQKMYKGSSETWKKYREHIGELLEALDEAGVEYDKS